MVTSFGARPRRPRAGDDANAPQTNMPPILTGFFAASDPKNGLAIIGTTASNAKVYPVGERVPGNAVVHAALYRSGAAGEKMAPSKPWLLPPKVQCGQRFRAPAGRRVPRPWIGYNA